MKIPKDHRRYPLWHYSREDNQKQALCGIQAPSLSVPIDSDTDVECKLCLKAAVRVRKDTLIKLSARREELLLQVLGLTLQIRKLQGLPSYRDRK